MPRVSSNVNILIFVPSKLIQCKIYILIGKAERKSN